MEIRARDLKVFCAVIDSGSLLAASGRVALSPSAISRVISQLEQDLGTTLFDRTERRLVPTAFGREFHARSREALALWSDLADFARNRPERHSTPLRVAALSRHAETIVAPAMSRLLHEHAGISLQLDVHTQRDFGFSRLARPFEIGFGHLVAPQEELEVVPLARSRLVAVVAPSHALADHQSVSLAMVAGHPLVQLSQDTVMGTLGDRLFAKSSPAKIVARVSHVHVALRMVETGIGLHVTDELAALSAQERGCRLVPIQSWETLEFSAFWPKRATGADERIALACTAVVKRLQEAGAHLDKGAAERFS